MRKEDSNELLFYASSSPIFLVRNRCKAVYLILCGEKKIDVAEELCCSRMSINEWLKMYNDHGISALLSIDEGGRPLIIPAEKHDEMREIILNEQLKTSPSIGNELQKVIGKNGFSLSLSSVYNFLHRLKLSYQTPRPVHPKRDENEVKKWISSFPTFAHAVAQQHRDKNIEIYFSDETRFGQQGILVRQWSEVGKRPVHPRQIEYKNAWIFGAINPQTGHHYGVVTTHAATDFMQKFIDSFSSSRRKHSNWC